MSIAGQVLSLSTRVGQEIKAVRSLRGAANGVASLDGSTKVPVSQIPALSYAPSSGIAPSAITGTAVINSDARLTNARPPQLTDTTAWNSTSTYAVGSVVTYGGLTWIMRFALPMGNYPPPVNQVYWLCLNNPPLTPTFLGFSQGQYNINWNTWSLVPVDTVGKDNYGGSGFSGYVCQQPGYYMISGSILWYPDGRGGRYSCIAVNGNLLKGSGHHTNPTGAFNVTAPTQTIGAQLAANDVVTLRAYQNAANPIATKPNNTEQCGFLACNYIST